MNNIILSTRNIDDFISDVADEVVKKIDLWNDEQPVPKKPTNKYTLPEAAEYCKMAEPTFRTYIYGRKVSGTKFGKAWLFLESDLDKFIEAYRRPSTNELKASAFESLTSTKKGRSK